jgi:hypothetical protein
MHAHALPPTHARAARAGGISAVVAALQALPDDPVIQEHGCAALWYLSVYLLSIYLSIYLLIYLFIYRYV